MTTPAPSHRRTRSRSNSRHRGTPSRPTTPLRPPSRSSLRHSSNAGNAPLDLPLEALEPQFAELSDSIADLEANMMHLQLLHESLARFSENFAGFLYGLNVNAFCVDFPDAPVQESFKRARQQEQLNQDMASLALGRSTGDGDGEATFLTTDTSFVENPPTSSKVSSKFSTPAAQTRGAPSRGAPSRGAAASRSTRGRSGLARATTRGRGRP